MNKIKIPVNEPLLKGNEKKYVLKSLKDGFVSSSGPLVKKFEKKFARRLKKKYAISVSNGTAAIQLAFESLKLKKGDEVILPTFTIISCILPVVRSKATPILVDSDPITWNMKIQDVIKKITKKTKLIIVPHIYGLPVEMDSLLKIVKKKKIKIIEDTAEVLGLKYKNKECGTFGDISTFSFYANKHITTGEGGMILTDNKEIADKCKSLRNICFNEERRFLHYELGWNYRFTNIQAAIGLAQLEKLNSFIKKKRRMGLLYNEAFKNIKSFNLPPSNQDKSKNIFWVYGIVLNKHSKINVKQFMKKLEEKGIETRNFFWPLHQQPILKKLGYFKKIKLPVSEYIAKNGFYLPSGLGLNNKQQNFVIKTVKQIVANS